MHKFFALVLSLGLWTGIAHALEPALDIWQDLRRFEGEWRGESEGKPGHKGQVERRYTWVMQGRYLQERNFSTYPPNEKNKSGERHEHWSMFSYENASKTHMLRQFHVEGFINTYRRLPNQDGKLVFESTQFENFNNAWRARESYEFISDDEFIETFELAPPGKEYAVYSRTHLKRQR